jgi:hypothetical protein
LTVFAGDFLQMKDISGGEEVDYVESIFDAFSGGISLRLSAHSYTRKLVFSPGYHNGISRSMHHCQGSPVQAWFTYTLATSLKSEQAKLPPSVTL